MTENEKENNLSRSKPQSPDLESLLDRLAHDLRSPLRSISSYSEILKEEYSEHRLDEEGLRMIDRISYNSKKMSHLLEQILSFVKAGKTELNRTEVNVNEIGQRAWKEAIKKQSSQEVTLTITGSSILNTDKDLLQKLLHELFLNAILFCTSEKANKVEMNSKKEEDGSVVISIKDNGVGFENRYKEFIFQLFQRLHNMSQYEGAGLGLSIAKRISERLNADLWAESQPGNGASFYISFPKTL